MIRWAIGMIQNPTLKLFLCGAAALFWELVLIRWMGSTIRVVAYYSNFVLIAAFFGLGAGALLVRYKFRLRRAIFGTLAICVLGSPLLGSFFHLNPATQDEFVWLGAPLGVTAQSLTTAVGTLYTGWFLPYWVLLALAYFYTAFLFLIFGQWLGELFQELPPLKAYTVEISGSILGILLFALISFLQLTPTVWFLVGYVLVVLTLDQEKNLRAYLKAGVFVAVAVVGVRYFERQFTWSPYYKIHLTPVTEVGGAVHASRDAEIGKSGLPVAYALTVNDDFLQMIVDGRAWRRNTFFESWIRNYEYPYHPEEGEPQGPILIVGAGTGNDVSAALRRTQSVIRAVEIDPVVVRLGRIYHFERPYEDPRVEVIVDDARSFFMRTNEKYAKIVFGYLDSHTLMSSFASVRLDNFVYTYESMKRVKELLLPGGKVYVGFATGRLWLHERFISLLDAVFDYPTSFKGDIAYGSVMYVNGKADNRQPASERKPASRVAIPTDDWPFLYMKEAAVPNHYKVFMVMVVLMGVSSLLFLPSGQRKIRLPYFFMGAGFFLLETSNVVSLALLYGSTWVVNVTVFTGILVLILLGNITCMLTSKPRYLLTFTLLFLNLAVSYLVRPDWLLGVDSDLLQGVLAVLIFLGPVFFASLIFGQLIKAEKGLYQAYGSNLLGAVIGGSCEYFSLVFGIKSLLIITFGFYLLAFLFLQRSSTNPSGDSFMGTN